MNEGSKPSDPIYPSSYRTGDLQFMDKAQQNWRLNLRGHAWRPPTDVYETEDSLIVRIEIAGMQESDFEISLNGRILSIHGIRQDNPEKRAYYQMEIHFGEFAIELEIPVPILAEQVQAIYHNGFLRLVLPKALPRQIPINE